MSGIRRMTSAMLGALVVATMGWASELHVSPAGDDGNAGTAAKPLATLAGAQRIARTQVAAGPVTIRLHEGVYYLPETLRFTPADAGCTYAAAEGSRVVVSGGSKLALEWRAYRDGIMQATTPAGLTIDELFVNGGRQRMARYPNYKPDAPFFGGTAADAMSRERAAKWADPTGGYIHALHKRAWGGMHYRITGKNANSELTYEGGWQNNRPSEPNREHRFVENVFEELDAPGEWFHDSKTQTLYLLPLPGVDLASATIEVAGLPHLIEFVGTKDAPIRNVSLRGITFRHTARTFMLTREPLLRSDWMIYRGGAIFFTGAEDCSVVDCDFDQLGGNAIFVSGYNRRITITGCDIHDTGGSAVAFVGDPKAVRSPRFRYGQTFKYDQIDKTPGPQSEDYPGECLVDDCLIRGVGTVEKQAAGVQISMSSGITVRHCTIYDTSRAGINISEGTFGGHVIEFCDVFDTVRETGDHGSFNSWGRDRFWQLGGAPEEELAALAMLDMVKPNIIRNSRWRCDHGWDVDLDDGSSNYEIYNNLFLRGGLKLREGFNRKVFNNIAVNGTLHPHVWYEGSGDEVTRNIWMGAYRPAIMRIAKWGKEVDHNLFTTSDADRTKYASKGCDENSRVGDAMFVDAAKGDFHVKDESPALALGFKNFPMDKFGVQAPRLRAMAKTPEIPPLRGAAPAAKPKAEATWHGVSVRPLQDSEFSAIGVAADAVGVLVTKVAPTSLAAAGGLRVGDFVQMVNERPVGDAPTFLKTVSNAKPSEPLKLAIVRGQQPMQLTINKDGK